jgi:gentisate 1,2-dioxygenase
VSKTLGGRAERLNAGKSSTPIRETASSVYHVIEGNGYTEIEGQKIFWGKHDTFCIPSWHKYQHFAGKDETVYLYRFDEKPMLDALGFYRTDDVEVESLVS